ncbi:dodecin domain-containing protein [bacterium]|nr:dodecin domain-containing protein [bacterium]
MSDHVYKIIDVVGSSRQSIEDAVHNAITHVGEAENNIRWFQVVETRGQVENGKVAYWQVTVKLGITAA